MGPLTASGWIFLLATLVLLPFLFRERTRNSSLGVDRSSGENSLLDGRNLVGLIFIGVVGLVPASAFLARGREMVNGFEPFPHLPYGTRHHRHHGFHHSQGEDDVGKMAELADFNIRRADPFEY
jgi:hypothetical protein